MDLTSDFPFWTVRNGLIRAYPPMLSDLRCDVLVVGGGITGSLLAHELDTRGIHCLVVERRDIGHGSTSASTALLQYEIDTPLDQLIGKVGRSSAVRAYQLGVESIRRLHKMAPEDAGLRMRPSMKITQRSRDLKGLQSDFEARRLAGLPVRWLDAAELRKIYGFPRAGAILSSVAAEMDPYRMAHHLFGRIKGRVFDRTKIQRYETTRTGIIAHTDRGSKVRAKAIFFATGYETQDFLPKRLVKIRSTYALVSEPLQNLDFWHRRALIWETGDPYLYTRTTSDNRIIIGGEDDSVIEGSRRDRQLGNKTKRLMRSFASLFPNQSIEPAFSWAGSFGSTRDGLPYIGSYTGFPRGYFALGFGGNGITFSVMAATILADLFEGKRNSDAAIFRFAR